MTRANAVEKHLGDLQLSNNQIFLLHRPYPREGECWAGYLLRIANSNLLDGIKIMASCVNASASALISDCISHSLHRIGIKLPTEVWAQAGVFHESHWACHTCQVRDQTRFCPICLQNDAIPYMRARWGFVLTTACPEHQVMLIAHCSSCNAPIHLLRRHLLKCDCGKSFIEMPPRSIEAVAAQLPLIFHEAIPKDQTATFASDHPLASRALSVIWKILFLVGSNRTPHLRETLNLPNAEEMRLLGELTSDWPHNAKVAFPNHRDFTPRNNNNRIKHYFFTYDFAATELLAQDFFSAEVSHDFGDCTKHEVEITIRQLERITGYPINLIRRLIRDNRIPGFRILCRARKQVTTIPSWVHERIHEICRQTFLTREAALFMGCHVETLAQMLSAGLISYFFLFDISPSNHAHIFYARMKPAEVRIFAERYFNLAIHPPSGRFSSWVSLDECRQFWAPDSAAKHWVALMKAVRTGEISIRSIKPQPSQLAQLFLRKCDLTRIIKQEESNDVSHKATAARRRVTLQLAAPARA